MYMVELAISGVFLNTCQVILISEWISCNTDLMDNRQ